MSAEILVIDDSATMRKLVELAFRGSDCSLRFAASGEEGLAEARRSPPGAILLDFMLPDMKGIEVCRQLAQRHDTSRIGVVVMSGKAELAELFRDVPNVVGFLAKPFSAEAARSRLWAALGRTSQAPGAQARSESSAPAASEHALTLHGDLATVPLYDVLRFVLATKLTGVLELEPGERIYLAEGSVMMCTTTRPTDELDQLVLRGGADLDGALTAARITQRQSGKPALVTLAEGGFEIEVDIAAALKAHGNRLLASLLACRAGSYTWRRQVLPDYVQSFGRPIALLAVALDQARAAARPAASGPELLDHIYQRAAHFSDSIAGLRLTGVERTILAAVDGHTSVRLLAERTKLAPRQLATTISHLEAVELITRLDHDSTAGAAHSPPPILVHGLDGEFVEQLRAVLARRPSIIPVLQVAQPTQLDALVTRAKPQLILVGADSRPLAPELRALARLTAATLVAVLDLADEPTLAATLALGYDAALLKPVHITELEHLLAL